MNRSLVRTFQVDCKYVFVDWAGDPGFRFRDGSSQHFIVVAVFTGDYGLMRQRLALLRQQRQLSPDFHLKKVTARPAVEEAGLQMADMIAGAALDDAGGSSHSYLAQLGNKLEIVYMSEEENRPG